MKVTRIGVEVKRQDPRQVLDSRVTLKVTAYFDAVTVFEKEIVLPPVDDITTVFEQAMKVVTEAMTDALAKAKERDAL